MSTKQKSQSAHTARICRSSCQHCGYTITGLKAFDPDAGDGCPRCSRTFFIDRWTTVEQPGSDESGRAFDPYEMEVGERVQAEDVYAIKDGQRVKVRDGVVGKIVEFAWGDERQWIKVEDAAGEVHTTRSARYV